MTRDQAEKLTAAKMADINMDSEPGFERLLDDVTMPATLPPISFETDEMRTVLSRDDRWDGPQ